MSYNFRDVIKNIFHADETEAEQTNATQQNVSNYVASNGYNPFLKEDGTLYNPYLNYQRMLDNPNVSDTVKNYIQQATGYTPTDTEQETGYTTEEQPTNDSSWYTSVPSYSSTPYYTSNYSDSSNVQPYATGSGIADNAQKYIGTPYVWGGENMEEGGMDCSGFVYNALKDSGYNYGRTTAQGYRSYGTKVSKEEMQPGDLMFFGQGSATHIGIYLGNGKMIHSAGGSSNTKSNPGKGVSIVDVNHRSDFIEARRMPNGNASGGNTNNTSYRAGDQYIDAPTDASVGRYEHGQYPVGQRIGNIDNKSVYDYSAGNLGHCVWYVRGRANEKWGAQATWRGNGNVQCANAPAETQVEPTIDNLQGDMFASFQKGTSKAGQTAGHVVYIEDVVGDIVYFTDGGRNSSYAKGFTGGTVRTATREQFMNGVDSNGKRFGTDLVGLADVTKFPGYSGPQRKSTTPKAVGQETGSTIAKATASTRMTQGEKDARSSSREMEEWKSSKSGSSKSSSGKSSSTSKKSSSNKSSSNKTVSTKMTQSESDARSSSREMEEWRKSKNK